MANNVSYPLAAGTIIETVDQGLGVHRPVHKVGESALPVGAATADNQTTAHTRLGSATEPVPANDTASSGLNGRLQRIAQRLTTLISLFPVSLGQKIRSASFAVTIASDDDLLVKVGEVHANPTANTVLDRLKSLGTALAGTLTFQSTPDQDPIFDHTNGVKVSVSASTDIITPPANCKYLRIGSDADIFVNTSAIALVVDDGKSIRIIANQPETIPVVPGVVVRASSASGTAVVRATPLKVR